MIKSYSKLFFFLATCMSFSIGLIAIPRLGFATGGLSVLVGIFISWFVVSRIKASDRRRLNMIQIRQSGADFRTGHVISLLYGLIILIIIPILILYTPLRRGIKPNDMAFFIIVIEVFMSSLMFLAFRRAFHKQPVVLPSIPFLIISFIVAVIAVILSHYNKRIAVIVGLGWLPGYLIYQDFFKIRRGGKVS